MATGNLAARLSRIRAGSQLSRSTEGVGQPPSEIPHAPSAGDFSVGWETPRPLVRTRTVELGKAVSVAPALDPALGLLCPGSADAFPEGAELDSRRILFFDLETTGLSGGAGTIAFLAAFGRLRFRNDTPALELKQYLLLDYPGESDFMDLVLSEFADAGQAPVLASYNGKSFDMQLLRSRCLMNGRRPPELPHLDLVHGSRRLWRRMLGSCSLTEVERGILGIDRGEDLGGAEAPDAWFDYLKTGESGRLRAICEHNLRDLEGLAALLGRMESIARDPRTAVRSGAADAEGLALRWLAALRTGRPGADGAAARELLELAVARDSPRCAWALARLLSGEGNAVRGAWPNADRVAELRRFVAEAADGRAAAGLRAAACRQLARDAARRLGDYGAARAWIARALAIAGDGSSLAPALQRAAAVYERGAKTRE